MLGVEKGTSLILTGWRAPDRNFNFAHYPERMMDYEALHHNGH